MKKTAVSRIRSIGIASAARVTAYARRERLPAIVPRSVRAERLSSYPGPRKRGKSQGLQVPGNQLSRPERRRVAELRPDRVRIRARRIPVLGLEDRLVVRRAEREPGRNQAVQRIDVVLEHIAVDRDERADC